MDIDALIAKVNMLGYKVISNEIDFILAVKYNSSGELYLINKQSGSLTSIAWYGYVRYGNYIAFYDTDKDCLKFPINIDGKTKIIDIPSDERVNTFGDIIIFYYDSFIEIRSRKVNKVFKYRYKYTDNIVVKYVNYLIVIRDGPEIIKLDQYLNIVEEVK